jgi:hypothetical protein
MVMASTRVSNRLMALTRLGNKAACLYATNHIKTGGLDIFSTADFWNTCQQILTIAKTCHYNPARFTCLIFHVSPLFPISLDQQLPLQLMRLSAMHPLIGSTERTDILFNAFHKAEDNPLLARAGMTTDRAQLTNTGKL